MCKKADTFPGVLGSIAAVHGQQGASPVLDKKKTVRHRKQCLMLSLLPVQHPLRCSVMFVSLSMVTFVLKWATQLAVLQGVRSFLL